MYKEYELNMNHPRCDVAGTSAYPGSCGEKLDHVTNNNNYLKLEAT